MYCALSSGSPTCTPPNTLLAPSDWYTLRLTAGSAWEPSGQGGIPGGPIAAGPPVLVAEQSLPAARYTAKCAPGRQRVQREPQHSRSSGGGKVPGLCCCRCHIVLDVYMLGMCVLLLHSPAGLMNPTGNVPDPLETTGARRTLSAWHADCSSAQERTWRGPGHLGSTHAQAGPRARGEMSDRHRSAGCVDVNVDCGMFSQAGQLVST